MTMESKFPERENNRAPRTERQPGVLWLKRALLEVGLNEGAKISSVSLVPVVLEDGLPRMEVTKNNRFGSR